MELLGDILTRTLQPGSGYLIPELTRGQDLCSPPELPSKPTIHPENLKTLETHEAGGSGVTSVQLHGLIRVDVCKVIYGVRGNTPMCVRACVRVMLPAHHALLVPASPAS